MSEVAFMAEGSRPAPLTRTWGARLQLGSESGQGLVEYALILVVVSIVAIFLIVSMGTQLNNMFSNVVAGLGT
jgi:pilus assembly protein Flp/PilA